jgi:catechol 2,3-dioxygenase-like lactoylglutathione lyase family enzyme
MSPIVDRRRFLLSLPGVAFAPRIIAQMGSQHVPALALNHVVLSVSDPGRSVEFYQGLFGMPIQARQGGTIVLRVGDGPQFMAVGAVARGQAPSVSRLGIAVDDFDADRIIERLAAFGVRRAGPGMPAERALRAWTLRRGAEEGGGSEGTEELYFGDPGGIVTQIVDAAHCGGAGPLGTRCGAPDLSPLSGLLAVRDISHCCLGVSDPPRWYRFYQDAFGLPVQALQGSTAALGLGGGPQFLMAPGSRATTAAPGAGYIDHACLTVEGFDKDEILGTLSDFGIQPRAGGGGAVEPLRSYISMRMPNRGGAEGGTPELYFTDPDGIRIQLQDTTYCGGGGPLGEICY